MIRVRLLYLKRKLALLEASHVLGHRQDKHTDSIAINAPRMRNEMFLLCDNLGQQLCLYIDK